MHHDQQQSSKGYSRFSESAPHCDQGHKIRPALCTTLCLTFAHRDDFLQANQLLAQLRCRAADAQLLAGAIQKAHQDGNNMASMDFSGATPMHMAAVFGQTAAVEALLQAGAAPNLADKCAAPLYVCWLSSTVGMCMAKPPGRVTSVLHHAALPGSFDPQMLPEPGNPPGTQERCTLASTLPVIPGCSLFLTLHYVKAGSARQAPTSRVWQHISPDGGHHAWRCMQLPLSKLTCQHLCDPGSAHSRQNPDSDPCAHQDLNARAACRWGHTPLMCALTLQHPKVVKALQAGKCSLVCIFPSSCSWAVPHTQLQHA